MIPGIFEFFFSKFRCAHRKYARGRWQGSSSRGPEERLLPSGCSMVRREGGREEGGEGPSRR